MSHTFLALDMDIIPQSTKDNVPTFWSGRFSNDNSKMLIDGYNEDRKLVHTQNTLNMWLYFEPNKQQIIDQLISTAVEYTKEEIDLERVNPLSIWYEEVNL